MQKYTFELPNNQYQIPNIMKLQTFKNIFIVFTLVPLILISCKKNIGGNGTVDKAEYFLQIESIDGSGSNKQLIGDDVSSNWDSENGIVWLGTDDSHLPTGTLTLEIGSPFTNKDGEQEAVVGTAALSTQDKLSGTDVHARTYSHEGMDAKIIVDKIGSNYIKAKRIDIIMERVLYYSDDLPETIHLTGSFTARIQ